MSTTGDCITSCVMNTKANHGQNIKNKKCERATKYGGIYKARKKNSYTRKAASNP